jgi:hypothetical protein
MITSDAEEDDIASFHRLLISMNDLKDNLEAIMRRRTDGSRRARRATYRR